MILFVHFWAQNKSANFFEQAKAKVLADVVAQWFEGLAAEEKYGFEAAAMLRSFNRDSLRALAGGVHEDADRLYEHLRQSPFVQSHQKGWVVHDVVREIIFENLRVNSPADFGKYHQRAVETMHIWEISNR